MGMTLIKKLSSKSIIGNVKKVSFDNFYIDNDIEKAKPDAPGQIDLFNIIGIVKGFKTGTTDNGEWISFEGDFKATRLLDGEVFRGPRAFISEPAQSMLEQALEDNETVEMAFMVSIVPGSNAYGYEYRTSPLITPAENDGIAALELKIKSLPAPVKPAPKAKK